MSKQPLPAPTASAVGPCPILIQISRTPRHWKFTQHHRTTRPPALKLVTVLMLSETSLSQTVWRVLQERKVEEAFGDGFKVLIPSHETDKFLRNDEN